MSIKRFGFLFGVALLIVAAPFTAMYFLGRYQAWIYRGYQYVSSWALEAEAKAAAAKLEEQYLSDTDGGKTPEETIQMLVDRLRANDIEGASKLYLIEDQEKAKKEFRKIFTEDGNFDFAIRTNSSILSSGSKKNLSTNRVVFSYTGPDRRTYLIGLEQSAQTKVWKLAE